VVLCQSQMLPSEVDSPMLKDGKIQRAFLKMITSFLI
jgi:hypothetical protein